MARPKKLTPEQKEAEDKLLIEKGLLRNLEDIRKKFKAGFLPKNPTRFFKVGDQIAIGAVGTTHVSEVLDDGLIYRLHSDYMGKSYGQPIHIVQDRYAEWIDVFPCVSKEEDEIRESNSLRDKDDVLINYFNNDIDSLLSRVYNAGVDFKPDYQRDLVWTLEQKNSLIDSIFKNVDIGKFTFIKHDYSKDIFLEILDGKQRLTTLCEFYEDRFAYNGKKFSEMSFLDRHQFSRHHIVVGEVENLTQKQIYKLFLKMNTSGTPIDPKHLERIKELYEKS